MPQKQFSPVCLLANILLSKKSKYVQADKKRVGFVLKQCVTAKSFLILLASYQFAVFFSSYILSSHINASRIRILLDTNTKGLFNTVMAKIVYNLQSIGQLLV